MCCRQNATHWIARDLPPPLAGGARDGRQALAGLDARAPGHPALGRLAPRRHGARRPPVPRRRAAPGQARAAAGGAGEAAAGGGVPGRHLPTRHPPSSASVPGHREVHEGPRGPEDEDEDRESAAHTERERAGRVHLPARDRRAVNNTNTNDTTTTTTTTTNDNDNDDSKHNTHKV